MPPAGFLASMSNLSHSEVMICFFYYNTLTRTCMYSIQNLHIQVHKHWYVCAVAKKTKKTQHDALKFMFGSVKAQRRFVLLVLNLCLFSPFPAALLFPEMVIQESEDMINESNSDPCPYLLSSECVPFWLTCTGVTATVVNYSPGWSRAFGLLNFVCFLCMCVSSNVPVLVRNSWCVFDLAPPSKSHYCQW